MNAMLIVLLLLAALEVVCRRIFPKPTSWPKPQVRSKLDTTFGYLHLPKQRCYSRDAHVTINSLGFRGPELLERDASTHLRVLAIGNSLTFGLGVDDDATYPRHLERLLRKQQVAGTVEVINAGIGAFTIRQQAALLDHKLPELNPDLVLLGMHWLDLHHHPRMGQRQDKVSREAWNAVRRRFEETEARLVAPKTVGERARDLARQWRSFYVLYHVLQERRSERRWAHRLRWGVRMLTGEIDHQIEERLKFSAQQLPYLAQLCQRHSARFFVAFFPDYRQLTKTYASSVWPSALIEICKEADIPCVDLLPVLREARSRLGRKLFVPYDITHYGADGNEIIARTICDALQREALLEWSSPVTASTAAVAAP